MSFALHPRLAADTIPLGRLALSRLMLMNDVRYPWLILVPERPGIREIFELDEVDRRLLIEEIAACSRALDGVLKPDKINVAALGNLVPQLHIHVIARYANDSAWPKPVWGVVPARPYAAGEAERLAAAVTARLGMALSRGEHDEGRRA